MEEIIQEDKSLFLFLNTLGNSTFDQFWIMVSGTFVWVPLYIIFLYFLYKTYKPKALLYILLFILIGVTVSDQLATIFKLGIERFRPCHDPSLEHQMRIVQCGGNFGFYSAHASNTFFLASYLSILFKNKLKNFTFLVFAWAAFVSYSRIYLGVHFPLDILTGAAMGFLLGGFFATLAKKVIYKQVVGESKG